MTVQIKRIYEPAVGSDGLRVLVDRIWPRGVGRGDAKLDCWLQAVSPSTELRRWFGHKPERWQEFRRRYRAELKHNPAVKDLGKLVRRRFVTLLYGARDPEHNHALVLAVYLRRLAAPQRPRKPAKVRKRAKAG